MSKFKVLFYVPNLIDYLRLILIIYGWINIDYPVIFLSSYLTQIFLDFFDGYFARLLNQISSFGAWLDVVLDNLGRGILWCYLFKYGFLVSCVEWITFSITQRHGAKWKEWFANQPFLIKHVFKNNFRTPIGLTAITAGLQGLPVWCYVLQHFEVTNLAFSLVLIYCILGRLLCLFVELWIIYKNVMQMIQEDHESNLNDKEK